MMEKFLKLLKSDKELTDLKEQYEKKFGKPAFGYNYDEFPTIEDYKNRLRKRIEEKKD
jgi:hypothetical protein